MVAVLRLLSVHGIFQGKNIGVGGSPGGLLTQGLNLFSPVSPALVVFFTTKPPGWLSKPHSRCLINCNNSHTWTEKS